MKHKHWSVIIGLLLVVSMILTACNDDEEATDVPAAKATDVPAVATKAPEPTEPPPPPGADKQGGVPILGYYQEPELLNA